jgi:hypothetical protein
LNASLSNVDGNDLSHFYDNVNNKEISTKREWELVLWCFRNGKQKAEVETEIINKETM